MRTRDARPDPLFVFEGGPGGGAATLAILRGEVAGQVAETYPAFAKAAWGV